MNIEVVRMKLLKTVFDWTPSVNTSTPSKIFDWIAVGSVREHEGPHHCVGFLFFAFMCIFLHARHAAGFGWRGVGVGEGLIMFCRLRFLAVDSLFCTLWTRSCCYCDKFEKGSKTQWDTNQRSSSFSTKTALGCSSDLKGQKKTLQLHWRHLSIKRAQQ
jgi:hypothetical protein